MSIVHLYVRLITLGNVRFDELHRLEKRDKRIQKIMSVFSTIMGGVVIYVLVRLFLSDRCEYLEEIKQIAISGIIYEKVYQDWNRGTQLLKVASGQDEVALDITSNIWVIKGYYADDVYLNPVWDYVDEGDSLVKQSGSFYIRVKKNNKPWKEFKLFLGQSRCENDELTK